MASRTFHRKSRGGCNQCKARRIKCDENGPPCYGCVTRGLTCEYGNRARLAQQSRPLPKRNTIDISATSNEITNSVTPQATNPEGGKLVRKQSISSHCKVELALMNHWTATTHLTFCHQTLQKAQEEERKFWQQQMPLQALEYPYLLYAMFSITNLHLASQSDDLSIREKHITAGIEYHSSSLELFMHALSNATKDNCQAIFICSLAFFVLSIALPQMVPTEQEEQASVKDSIAECLELYRGSRRILNLFEQELKGGPSAAILAPKDMSVYPYEDLEFSCAITRLRECVQSQNSLVQYGEAMCRLESITVAINELEGCSKRLANGIHAALVGWLIALEDEFLNALREEDVLATITVMHWAVLLDKPDRLWWSFRSGHSLIKDLFRVIPPLNALELESLNWCCSQVGFNPRTE